MWNNVGMHPDPLKRFVEEVSALVDTGADEARVLAGVREAMKRLVSQDDWLPAEMTKPHPQYYQQYLLYADPGDRFSVVSFVWGPGQKTPVHDHTVWGVIGMLRGAEQGERFALDGPGRPMKSLGVDVLEPGEIDCVSPTIGDIHRVSNLYPDRVSISIHVYGGNIGRIQRHVYDEASGSTKDFVSGYTNEPQLAQAAS